jgi:predicted TIM-barrel fold metal-dependent hydrolase
MKPLNCNPKAEAAMLLEDERQSVWVDPRLGYRAFDADNHYYEATDALTRHLPKAMSARGARWIEMNGRRRLMLGDSLFHFIPNAAFDPVARPGCLHDYFAAETDIPMDPRELMGELEPIRPEYRDRDARLKVMAAQGLEKAWLFPTLAVGVEVAMQPDIEAALATLRAFNRWLQDDWGLNYKDRLFAAPVMSLSNLDWALEELEWAIAAGARVITMRNGFVYTDGGTCSPADLRFDPFWARVEEAGITMAPHAGDDGYDFLCQMWEPGASFRLLFNSPLKRCVTAQRAVPDFFAALVCHRLFERFPRLRVASIENGTAWVPSLLLKLHKGHVQTKGYYKKNPVDMFHENIWVAPFWEDKVKELAKHVPVERILFGSDWPHTEGTEKPLDFLDSVGEFRTDQLRRIMYDNTAELTAPAR